MLLSFLKNPLTKLEKYLSMAKAKDAQGVKHSYRLNFILSSEKCVMEGNISPSLNSVSGQIFDRNKIGKCEVDYDFAEIQKHVTLSWNGTNNFEGTLSHVALTQTYKRPWSILFIIPYLFKPIILCCTCMSSFWGIVLYIVLHGFTMSHIPFIVICCIMSAFLNAYFINKYYHS